MKVIAAGGSPALAEILYRFRGQNFNNREFWREIIVFLVKNEAIALSNRHQLQILLAYVVHLCDENIEFTIIGRNWTSMIRLAETWQRENNRGQYQAYRQSQWRGASYKPFEQKIEEGIIYRIIQLTTSSDLYVEGSRMSHCVSGYAHNCYQGQCSIWSLRRYKDDNETSLVTIQVNAICQIIQAKARFNAQPSQFDMGFVLEWARTEGIAFVRY